MACYTSELWLSTRPVCKRRNISCNVCTALYWTFRIRGDTKVLTDQSFVKGSTGCAFIDEDHILSYRLHSFNSACAAEIDAICRALLFIRQQRQRRYLRVQTPQVLCTVSMATRRTVRLFWRFCIKRSVSSRQGSCVPGHTCPPGREAAGAAAKEATPLEN